MTGRALLGLALLAALALAQPADSLRPQPVPPESTPKTDTARPYRPARSPGTAVLLSFLLPGGGQVYTGNWWKAALIAPAEVTLGYFSVKEHLAAVEAEGDSASYVKHRDARTAFLWWTGAVIAFSMADAYVSAQMFGFEREMRFSIVPELDRDTGPRGQRDEVASTRSPDTFIPGSVGVAVRVGIELGL